MDKNEIRKNIKEIYQNADLSSTEKSKRIQEIMNPTKDDNKENIHPHIECTHYEKECYKFYFACCNSYYDCHRCHNENTENHIINIETIECKNCGIRQIPSEKCNTCHILFSVNYCDTCKLWTKKNITHCDLCGLCRIGNKEDIYHCPTCDICFLMKDKEHHQCVKISYRNQICIFCLESIYHSIKKSFSTQCGHIIHIECFEKAIQNNIYKCSLCRKSLFNMKDYWNQMKKEIQNQPMPEDYFKVSVGDSINTKYGKCLIEWIENDKIYGSLIQWKLNGGDPAKIIIHKKNLEHIVSIYCNDCELSSNTKYHFIGLECLQCHGYNTIQKIC